MFLPELTAFQWDPKSPLLITGSQAVMHIQTNANKNAHIRFHSKTPHRVTKKNENLNMDNTITGSINIRSSLTTSIV
jgi:hypothetical protein